MFYSAKKDLWIERVEISGGRTKEISAKTKNALARKLTAFRADIKNGPKFSDVADEWLESHSRKIEETTAQSYSAHVNRAKKFFEDEYIKDITPDEVQGFIDYLVERDFAKDTVRRGLVVMNKIFKFAITQPDSVIRFNPCAAVEVPRGLKQEQREPPTEAQINKVSFDPKTEGGLIALMLLCTGLRPCELLALTWDDIDRQNMKINIDKDIIYPTNTPVLKYRTKTKAGIRTVPLLKVLADVLPEKTGSEFIFGGEKPLTKTRFYFIWMKWCAENGLATLEQKKHKGANNQNFVKNIWHPDVTPYQFRHEYASMLEDENVGEFAAQHVMGHSSIVVTKDKYTHFRQKKNHSDEVADKLNARFAKVDLTVE